MMPSLIFRICDAYESGFGHGLQNDGHIVAPYADDDLCKAYEIGYKLGLERRAASDPVGEEAAQDEQAMFRAWINDTYFGIHKARVKDMWQGWLGRSKQFAIDIIRAEAAQEVADSGQESNPAPEAEPEALLPSRIGQAETMTICAGTEAVVSQEIGHWYSPLAVAKMLALKGAK